MAKKKESVADQICSLEKELKDKSDRLKSYDKILDKLLKEVFGKTKSEIDSLIIRSVDTTGSGAEVPEKMSEKKTEKQESGTESEIITM